MRRAKDILADVADKVLDPAALRPPAPETEREAPAPPAEAPVVRTPEEAAAAFEQHRREEEAFTHSDQHVRQTAEERREAERLIAERKDRS